MSFVLVAAILAGYGTVALLGPQGFFSLRDRYTEIRRLERENADLNRGNRELESLIKKVRESRSQQEVLVKDKLKYTHTNETQFVLPDSGKPQQPSEPASK
jgi:cell division protein FtsB